MAASSKHRQGGLIRALRRLVSTNEALESEDLRREAERLGARQVSDCADRERVVLRGTIRTITIAPADEAPRLEAEFDDGSGRVTLIWIGRRAIAGIQPGSVLRIEGRLSCQKGQRRMYNPYYELSRVPGAQT